MKMQRSFLSCQRPFLVLVVFYSLVLGACGGRSTPLDEWEPKWDQVVAEIDAYEGQPASHSDCEATLAFLREVRLDLDPPPLQNLREPVNSWFDTAEDSFFECDLSGQVFATLRTLEAEARTVLDLEG